VADWTRERFQEHAERELAKYIALNDKAAAEADVDYGMGSQGIALMQVVATHRLARAIEEQTRLSGYTP